MLLSAFRLVDLDGSGTWEPGEFGECLSMLHISIENRKAYEGLLERIANTEKIHPQGHVLY